MANPSPTQVHTVTGMASRGKARILKAVVIGLLGLVLVVVLGTKATPDEAEAGGDSWVLGVAFVAFFLPVLSQLCRGQWSIEPDGIRERIVPLLPLPWVGIRCDRLVPWSEMQSAVVKDVWLGRGRHTQALLIRTVTPPTLHIQRKVAGPAAAAFDRFVGAVRERLPPEVMERVGSQATRPSST